jgi:oxygen-independent coproporphyrinogen-3 oxidase
MSQQGIEGLEAGGYARYEVSAFARPGFECRHNLNYWRFGDYLGIGAGAHGKLTDLGAGEIWRSLKQRHPRAYLEAALNRRFDLKREVLARNMLPLEFMINSLRLVAGFELGLFSERSGLPLGEISLALAEAESRDLVEIRNGTLRPTTLGFEFLDDLLLLFTPATQHRPAGVLPCEPAGEGLISLKDH